MSFNISPAKYPALPKVICSLRLHVIVSEVKDFASHFPLSGGLPQQNDWSIKKALIKQAPNNYEVMTDLT